MNKPSKIERARRRELIELSDFEIQVLVSHHESARSDLSRSVEESCEYYDYTSASSEPVDKGLHSNMKRLSRANSELDLLSGELERRSRLVGRLSNFVVRTVMAPSVDDMDPARDLELIDAMNHFKHDNEISLELVKMQVDIDRGTPVGLIDCYCDAHDRYSNAIRLAKESIDRTESRMKDRTI
ncbi:hypothetical protein H6796_00570 [Candidatus Nomurabacteria bacterium]|nr:hypothetical protein [Candidatus Nomurabacteria bacterium]